MNQEVETLITEPWFPDTIRAIISEFIFEADTRRARIRKLSSAGSLTFGPVGYGRYRLGYNEAENVIYLG